MRYAQIVQGTVHGVYEYDPLPQFAPNIVMIELPADSPVQAGWLYEDGGFSEPPEPQPFVPDRVTMRQARLALHIAGILPQVQPAIDALPEPDKTVAQIEWDYSSEVFRNREFVNMLGGQLGLTSEQIDQLFIQAATL